MYIVLYTTLLIVILYYIILYILILYYININEIYSDKDITPFTFL